MTTIIAKKNVICQAKSVNGEISICQTDRKAFDPRRRQFDLEKFCDSIPDGEQFIYRLCFYSKDFGVNAPEYEERGIAVRKGHIIDRIELIDNKKRRRPVRKDLSVFPEGTLLSVESVGSDTDISIENSIFTSESIIKLNSKDCIILCDDKGNIGAADLSVITKYLKSIKRPVEVKSIKSESFQFVPSSRPAKPKIGYTLLNKRSGNLEFWDGLEWRDIS